MWYLPLNTQIESGASHHHDSTIVTLARETDEAVGFIWKNSRLGEGALIWVPKSQVLAIGSKAVCFDVYKRDDSSKREIMTRAWHIAKFAATSFGGSSREYFAEALKMAWAGD